MTVKRGPFGTITCYEEKSKAAIESCKGALQFSCLMFFQKINKKSILFRRFQTLKIPISEED